MQSQPSWAAWIEIISRINCLINSVSQPSWAAWIEISPSSTPSILATCRSPLGLRGLKSSTLRILATAFLVAALLGCVD